MEYLFIQRQRYLMIPITYVTTVSMVFDINIMCSVFARLADNIDYRNFKSFRERQLRFDGHLVRPLRRVPPIEFCLVGIRRAGPCRAVAFGCVT